MTSADPSVYAREEQFHDAWGESIAPTSVLVDESFEACTAPEGRALIEELGDLSGKRMLDLGCGAGEAAVYFAKRGASVVALDISEAMLKVVTQVATLHKVSVETKQANGEVLPFADASFDVVYAANYLHHVEIEPAVREIIRVLRPGGKMVTWDPLAHNPVINVYRRMASGVRTPDEHPLTMRNIAHIRGMFAASSVQTFWLCTLWIFLRFYLIERVNPNAERYWKKIVLEHQRLAPTYNRLERFDKILLSLLPFLKRYCWNVLIIGTKGDSRP